MPANGIVQSIGALVLIGCLIGAILAIFNLFGGNLFVKKETCRSNIIRLDTIIDRFKEKDSKSEKHRALLEQKMDMQTETFNELKTNIVNLSRNFHQLSENYAVIASKINERRENEK